MELIMTDSANNTADITGTTVQNSSPSLPANASSEAPVVPAGFKTPEQTASDVKNQMARGLAEARATMPHNAKPYAPMSDAQKEHMKEVLTHPNAKAEIRTQIEKNGIKGYTDQAPKVNINTYKANRMAEGAAARAGGETPVMQAFHKALENNSAAKGINLADLEKDMTDARPAAAAAPMVDVITPKGIERVQPVQTVKKTPVSPAAVPKTHPAAAAAVTPTVSHRSHSSADMATNILGRQFNGLMTPHPGSLGGSIPAPGNTDTPGDQNENPQDLSKAMNMALRSAVGFLAGGSASEEQTNAAADKISAQLNPFMDAVSADEKQRQQTGNNGPHLQNASLKTKPNGAAQDDPQRISEAMVPIMRSAVGFLAAGSASKKQTDAAADKISANYTAFLVPGYDGKTRQAGPGDLPFFGQSFGDHVILLQSAAAKQMLSWKNNDSAAQSQSQQTYTPSAIKNTGGWQQIAQKAQDDAMHQNERIQHARTIRLAETGQLGHLADRGAGVRAASIKAMGGDTNATRHGQGHKKEDDTKRV